MLYLCCERVTVIVGSKYQHATVAACEYEAQRPHNEQPQCTESKREKLKLILSRESIVKIRLVTQSQEVTMCNICSLDGEEKMYTEF